MKLKTILIMILFMFSCKNSTNTNNNDFEVKEMSGNKIFKQVDTITLEKNDSSLISWPLDLIKTQNNIIIASRNQPIIIFDEKGKYIKQIGSIGDGPGEFRRINSLFAIDDHNFGIYDSNNEYLSIYNINEGFKKTFSLKSYNLGTIRNIKVRDKKYYIHIPYFENYKNHIIVLDSNATFIEKYIEANDKYSGYSYFSYLQGNIHFNKNKSLLYEMNTYASNSLKILNMKNKKTKNIVLNYSEYKKIKEYRITNILPSKDIDENYQAGSRLGDFAMLNDQYAFVWYSSLKSINNNIIDAVFYYVFDIKNNISVKLDGGKIPIIHFCDSEYIYEVAMSKSKNNSVNGDDMIVQIKKYEIVL